MPRLPNDQYFTPPGAIYPLLKTLQLSVDDIIFEPCAGDMAIASCLIDEGFEGVMTADIDSTLTDPTFCDFDATAIGHWNEMFTAFEPGWVITNPPYKQPDCDRIIQNAWEFAEKGIAMLLRLTYLEPCKGRANFLKSAPLSNLIILNPRPKFIPNKTTSDASTVAWFVWRKDWEGGTNITFCTDWNG